jgi:hypothetical protein
VTVIAALDYPDADAGLNVDLTQHVHGRDEVRLRVAIEVSNVAGIVNMSGPNQHVPARKRNEADIRLRDQFSLASRKAKFTKDVTACERGPALIATVPRF